MNYQTSSGQIVTAGRLLAKGGEGEIFAVTSPPGTVLKKYLPVALARDSALDERLQAMIANPPAQRREPQSKHVTLAWPTDLVLQKGRFVGFLMDAVETSETVEPHQVTNPDDRKKATGNTAWARGFTWKYLIHAAANLAQATQMLHDCQVVIGDFNERNSRVTRDARITLLDCDSMQISDPARGGWFFCRVGRPEYTPPELMHADWSKTVRHPSGDLFALAIHIYQFLLEGEQPFRGTWNGPGEKPSVTELARQGVWAHKTGGMLRPRRSAIPADMLPDSIMGMFRAAFEDGAINPDARPAAHLWHQALVNLEASLQQCRATAKHFYPGPLRNCPWCRHEASRTITQQAPPTTTMPVTAQVPLAPVPQPTGTYVPLVTVPAPRVTPNMPLPVPPGAFTARKRSSVARKGVRSILILAALFLIAAIGLPPALSRSMSSPAASGVPTHPQVAGGQPPGSAAGADPVSGGSEAGQAAQLNSLLQNSSISRTGVVASVNEVQNCSDVSGGTSGLRHVASERSSELREAYNLPTDALPNGAALKSDLISAIKNSLDADNDFLSWADQLASCSGSAPEDSNYRAAMRASRAAQSDKKNVATLWNPIAQQHGFASLTAAGI